MSSLQSLDIAFSDFARTGLCGSTPSAGIMVMENLVPANAVCLLHIDRQTWQRVRLNHTVSLPPMDATTKLIKAVEALKGQPFFRALVEKCAIPQGARVQIADYEFDDKTGDGCMVFLTKHLEPVVEMSELANPKVLVVRLSWKADNGKTSVVVMLVPFLLTGPPPSMYSPCQAPLWANDEDHKDKKQRIE